MSNGNVDSADNALHLITQRELSKKLRVSTATIRKLEKRDPTFPKRRCVSERQALWIEEEIDEWIRSR